MPYVLVALSGPREGERFSLGALASGIVGRANGCDITIADQRLSRRHARFNHSDGRLFVEDLGSPNGTIVNGHRVDRTELREGDLIVLGKTQLRVEGETTVSNIEELPDEPPFGPKIVKPVRVADRPSLDRMAVEEYYQTLGLGDDTLLDASADRFSALLRKTRDYAILHRISFLLQRAHDPKEMLAQVVDLVLEVTRADRGFVALLDESEEPHVDVVRSRSGATPALSGDPMTAVVSRTVARHVIEEKCAVICPDAAEDARFSDADSLLLNSTRSLMAVPILVGNRGLGLIQVESSHLGARFSEEDLDLVTIVATTVGVALDNLHLAERREATIRALEEAQARLVATQDRLVHSERMAAVGRFAAGISHEVKNHLSPFMLAAMMARKYPDDAEIQEAAEIMLEAQQHILDLVSELRAFVGGSQTSYELSDQDLAGIVEGVLRFVRCDRVVARAKVVVEYHARPIVEVDQKSVRQVLVNLLRNAAEAAPSSGGQVRVEVAIEAECAVVRIADNGPGIPEAIAARIFDPFFSTKAEAGLGLGLDISKKIVEDHGGRLTFTSSAGAGTTFRVELPLAGRED